MSPVLPPQASRLEYSLDKIGEVLRELNPGTLDYSIGFEDEVAKNVGPPRIVMQPAMVRFEDSAGAGYPSGRALFTRVDVVSAHVYGETLLQAEELLEQLLNAILLSQTWSFLPTTGSWKGRTEVTQRGCALAVDIEFRFPVMRAETRKPVTFTSPTGEIVT